MIYKRLYNGNVVLRSLCGTPPHPLDPATAATAVARHLNQGRLWPSRLWDTAHVLKQHAQCAVEASAALSAQAAAPASSPAAAKPAAGAEAQPNDHAAQGSRLDAEAGAAQLGPESTEGADAAASAGGNSTASWHAC